MTLHKCLKTLMEIILLRRLLITPRRLLTDLQRLFCDFQQLLADLAQFPLFTEGDDSKALMKVSFHWYSLPGAY